LLGAELRDFAQRSVAAPCWFDGGKVMSHGGYGRPCQVHGLYVHPKTGALLRAE
jgi:hypothetical protein